MSLSLPHSQISLGFAAPRRHSFPGLAPAADTALNRSDSAAGRPIGTNAARSSKTWIAYRLRLVPNCLLSAATLHGGRTSAERVCGVGWSVGGLDGGKQGEVDGEVWAG